MTNKSYVTQPSREHGSPYDRGRADSYYGRRYSPHHKLQGVTVKDITNAQLLEYRAGFNDNESMGCHKD